MLLSLSFEVVNSYPNEDHEFKVLRSKDDNECICALAGEYLSLRTECVVPLEPISVDGLEVIWAKF